MRQDTSTSWRATAARISRRVVPEGKTRSGNFTAPDEQGEYSLKCYAPGGVSSEIKVRVAGPS